MDLSRDRRKKTTSEMMANVFGKIIQERRGVKNVKTEEDKSQEKEKKRG